MKKRFSLFYRSKHLETEVEEFFQKLSESALTFKMALAVYLHEGHNDEFTAKLNQLCGYESRNDTLRRSIETQLYEHTLIPDARADVLALLENLDRILGWLEGGLFAFSIEKPEIPDQFKPGYLKLIEAVVQSVEYLILASREFFKNADGVPHYIHKVMFFEKEADKIGTALKRSIFDSDLDLATKSQLKGFVDSIDTVADGAEDVSDSLSIFAIKRSI